GRHFTNWIGELPVAAANNRFCSFGEWTLPEIARCHAGINVEKHNTTLSQEVECNACVLFRFFVTHSAREFEFASRLLLNVRQLNIAHEARLARGPQKFVLQRIKRYVSMNGPGFCF